MKRLLAGCAAIAVLTAACGTATQSGAASSSSASSSSAGTAPGGAGKFVLVGPLEPPTMAPQYVGTSTATVQVMRSVVQTLVGRNSETFELAPELALSWEQVEPTKWQFELRQGVTFHDGTPFNAEAAAASMAVIYDAAAEGSGNFVGAKATFKAIGEYTLEMTTEQPDPIVPNRMTQMPIATAAQLADPDAMAAHPIGTGPYKFVSWERGSRATVELYPESWLAKPGMYDTIEWVFRDEEAVRAQMVVAGEADATYDLQPEQCDGGTVACTKVPALQVWLLRIDQYEESLLGDTRVRKAIAMAIDRKALSDTFLSAAPVSNNASPEHSLGFDPDAANYEFDLDAAKELLAEAVADGIDITQPINIKTLAWRGQPFEGGSLVVEASLKDLGLNVTRVPVAETEWRADYLWLEGKTLLNDKPANRGDIWFTATGNELLDGALPGASFFSCDGIQSVYCRQDVEDAYDAASVLSGDERDAALKAAWRLAYDDVAFLPIAQATEFYAISDRLAVPLRPDNIIPFWLVGQ